MKIINKTSGSLISDDAGLADSFLGRLIGLMFQDRKDLVLEFKEEGIIESSIHMWFMRYPIDAAWVNDRMEVVYLKKDIPRACLFKLSTFGVHKPDKPAKYVVELGKSRLGDTKVGDVLEFTEP